MPEEKTQPVIYEVIALPPLKMVLVYAKEERLNKEKEKLKTNVNEVSRPVQQEEHVQPQDLKKLIEHLEKKP